MVRWLSECRRAPSPALFRLRASRHPIRPFPLREPIPSASAFTLVFPHSSAALWADQVDDRRDNVRLRFPRQYAKGHIRSPILEIGQQCEGQTGPRTTEMCRAGLVRSTALRTGWLRSPSRPSQVAAASLMIEDAISRPMMSPRQVPTAKAVPERARK